MIDGDWAVPRSLAATQGISVDFSSSGYLDVSVHQVRFLIVCIQIKMATEVGSHCLYAHGFRFYFTPLSGVLFAFPSRYWFTIGR